MRVVEATGFGGPEVLVPGKAPDPVATSGQAVVEVSVADVLFVDAKIRQGWGREYFPVTPPYVPGNGVAGVVAAVADGVDPAWRGTRVVARTGTRGGDGELVSYPVGGYAERAAVAVEELITVPDGLPLPEAMASLHDGPTAMLFFDVAQVRPGEWVLVTAAGGSLGTLLVQLAHAAGARVVGAAGSERKLDVARELGADAVVDYSLADWAQRVRKATDGAGVNVVFDGTGGHIGRAAFEVTAGGGRFFAYGSASGEFAGLDPDEAQRAGVTVVGLLDRPFDAAEMRRLTRRTLTETAAGRIRPVIGQTYPLERAVDAHAVIEARATVGKTVLLI
jgi:NADPH:quinone reductase